MKNFIRLNYKWLIIVLLLGLGSTGSELINGRFSMPDLEVYYETADKLIHGEEIYGEHVESLGPHYIYKYSPPAALIFAPLVALGFPVSRFIYWGILVFIFGSILYNIKVIFLGKEAMNSRITGSLILATLIVGTHFFRELHLGQVNLLLLGIYVFALRCFLTKKYAGMGVLLAFSIFIKPFALIFIPFLLLTRTYKGLLYLMGFIIVFFLSPLLFYHSIDAFTGLYASWLNELAVELGNKQTLLAEGNHTIFSVLARHSLLRLIEMSDTTRYLYQLIILCGIGFLITWTYLRRQVVDAPARIFIILIAIIPLLAFTSYNAFIFSLPLITYLMFKFRELGIVYKIVFVISCLCIGISIHDLIGKDLFDFFWAISIYSWGTIGLLVVIFGSWRKFSVRRQAPCLHFTQE